MGYRSSLARRVELVVGLSALLGAAACEGNREWRAPVGANGGKGADGIPIGGHEGGGRDGGGGVTGGSGGHPGAYVRLLAPMSGSIAGSQRPVLRWTGGYATVDICRDRACDDVLVTFQGAGEARPPAPLPRGTVFWRATASGVRAATWQLTIPGRDSGRPIFYGAVPDYNGDGMADVALGSPADDTGRVVIFYGAREVPGVDPGLILDGPAGFGCGVGCIGDVDGDGFADLAVTAGCGTGIRTVTIFHGAPGGPVKRRTLALADTAFGTTLASAGDVNGDGYGDLIVGGVEAAHVFFGGPTGISGAPSLTLPPGRGVLGAGTVQGPGDVNGDGTPDVSVTAGIDAASVYLGTGTGFVLQDVELPQESGGASFAGDVNGDGFVDFLSFAVLAGSPAGVDADLSRALAIRPATSYYTAAGDLHGDGFDDVIGLVSGGGQSEVRYWISNGSDTDCRAMECLGGVELEIPGVTSQDFAFVAGTGDVNGDGFADLVAARPSLGVVFLFLGGGRDVPSRTWTGPIGFGASVPALFGTATSLGRP